ncbi:PP2C family serine/threonine-protein phosphatase [Dyella sp.]|uniref:PP2C family protein-serine/threonine phosphatase n=1 Tax=Dyella sp. TaxID=1869338 RepID=UPI002ED4C452
MNEQVDVCALPGVAAGRALGGRASQQDAFICLDAPDEDARLMVLVDGMGGDGAGEQAAATVVEVARRLWQAGTWREQPGPLFLETLCQDAHATLRRLRETLAEGEPHSTIVALLIRDDRASWVHVGDTRLYLFQGLRCVSQTVDHSVAEFQRQRGICEGDNQHALLRGLGGAQPPVVDHGVATLRAGQGFALCTDGVWAHVSARELAEAAQARDLDAALRDTLALATQRGGAQGDNAALVLVHTADTGWIRRLGAWWQAKRPAPRNDVTA